MTARGSADNVFLHVLQQVVNPALRLLTQTAGMVSPGQYRCQPANSERPAFRYVKDDGRRRKRNGKTEDLRLSTVIPIHNASGKDHHGDFPAADSVSQCGMYEPSQTAGGPDES
jgi:hypothetical protein